MGGEESAESVALDAHQSEYDLHTDDEVAKRLGWYFPGINIRELVCGARIQDNVLIGSYLLCEETLDAIRRVYPADFGMSPETKGPQQQYLMGQIHIEQGALRVEPTSHNKQFATFESKRQTLTRIPPYFNDKLSPRAFGKEYMLSTLARFRQLCPRDSLLAWGACTDMYWELRRVGYTHDFILSVFCSIPPSKTTDLIRLFRSALKNHRYGLKQRRLYAGLPLSKVSHA
jgi:hypothetical protein